MKTIGLTGGIASGKSSISHRLGDLGAYVIDADKLGHRAYEAGTVAFDQVVTAFGADVVNSAGEIDRKVLGSKVFGNPTALRQLTDIAWPAIKRLAQIEINSVRDAGTHKVLILEAAVLIEAEWMDIVDEVWVVTVAREVAIERAMQRDNLSVEAVQSRIDSQISNDERCRHATAVFDNSGSWTELWELVEPVYQKVLNAT